MSRILDKENQITQEFGENHKGIDIVGKGSQLANILAHSDGTVVFCQTGLKNDTNSTGNASYGNCVKIKHNNGLYTLYAHMENVNVKLNEEVEKGQIIGYMGNTGRSFGAHLHFEVRNRENIKIDPTKYLDADLPEIQTGVVRELQHALNVDFNCNLAEDNSYGPLTKGQVTKHNIRQGAKGEFVKWVQTRLISKGYSCGNCSVDGSFGPATEIAVRKFQKDNRLVVDGIVGINTTLKLL